MSSSFAAAQPHILLTSLSISDISIFRVPRWSSKKGISRLGTSTSHLQAKCNPPRFFAMQFTRKQEADGHMQLQMSEFIHFPFELVQLRKILFICADNQSFSIQTFQLILNDFLIQQRNS